MGNANLRIKLLNLNLDACNTNFLVNLNKNQMGYKAKKDIY